MLSGCYDNRPEASNMEDFLNENYTEIVTILDYILELDCESVIINEWDWNINASEIWVDFEYIQVKDDKVKDAIEFIIGNGKCESIYKSANTVEFTVWLPFLKELSAGLAYSIDGINVPEVAYATETVPLSKDGWYFYFEDYNEWRVNNNTGND